MRDRAGRRDPRSCRAGDVAWAPGSTRRDTDAALGSSARSAGRDRHRVHGAVLDGGDEPVVAVVAAIEQLAPSGFVVDEEHERQVAEVEQLDRILRVDRRWSSRAAPDRRGGLGERAGRRGLEQLVSGPPGSRDHVVLTGLAVLEEVEVVVEHLEIGNRLIGGQLAHGEGLVAHELTFFDRAREVRRTRRGLVAVPPLVLSLAAEPEVLRLLVVRESFEPLTQACLEQIDGLEHRRGRDVRAYYPPVDVELGLRERPMLPCRIRVHGEIHPGEQHRSPHPAQQMLDLVVGVGTFGLAHLASRLHQHFHGCLAGHRLVHLLGPVVGDAAMPLILGLPAVATQGRRSRRRADRRGRNAGVRRVVIMGAGGRDFHNFNVVFRDDSEHLVVAFTAAQIPAIDDRTYPPSLAGPRYPAGIPIVSEDLLAELIGREQVDEVVLAYSDLSHEDVMHRASIVLSAGANFTLLGPRATMLHSPKPVVAVCATRTGAGKSQTSRRIGSILVDAGLRVALVRHPMPYGDLERMRVTALRHPRRHRRRQPDHRGTRGVRTPRRTRHGDLRGRRLRRGPRAGRGRGRCPGVGRRQQRLPVRRSRSARRGHRPATAPATSSGTTLARPACGWPTSWW